ncbi:hypothetical protein Micau_6291 [Micromonospora aurantiaca ATCC 27029]|nr:hypothetical protein Micau_6291 [Micromonospora aurantiaca ATCC 27029]
MRLGPFFQRSGDRSAPGADGFFSCVFHVKRRMRRPASRRGRSARWRRLTLFRDCILGGYGRSNEAPPGDGDRGVARRAPGCSLGAGRAARIPSRADHRSTCGRHRAASLVPGTAGTRSDEGRVGRRVSRETASASEPTGRARAGRTGLGFAGPRVCRSIADRARHRPGGVRAPGRPGERCRVIDGGANESASFGPGMLSRAAQLGQLAGLLATGAPDSALPARPLAGSTLPGSAVFGSALLGSALLGSATLTQVLPGSAGRGSMRLDRSQALIG